MKNKLEISKVLNVLLLVVVLVLLITGVYALTGSSASYTTYGKLDSGAAGNSTSTSYTNRFISGNQPVSQYTSNNYNGRLGVLTDNYAPQITKIINPGSINLNEGPSATNVSINFTVHDSDGASDLNLSTIVATMFKNGQSKRNKINCSLINSAGIEANYSCRVEMWWFDIDGVWNVNVSINDSVNNKAVNNTLAVIVNTLTSFVSGTGNITFAGLLAGTYNQTATNDPIVLNNTGNQNITAGQVSVNATHLLGEANSNLGIWAGNYSVGISTGGLAECNYLNSATSTRMNQTYGSFTNIKNSVLPPGNYTINDGTAQEQLYMCILEIGSELSQQYYSTNKSWTIKIN